MAVAGILQDGWIMASRPAISQNRILCGDCRSADTMIDVPCPQCGLMYHSELAHLGRCIKCSRCGATVPIIESAKAVVPSRHRRDSVRRSSSLKLNRQKWGVPILALAVALAIVLTALSLVWYRRENATTVRHADLR